MSIVDLLVTIIIVTILVTIVLAVVTYIAYKLRLARRPASSGEPEVSRYFDVHRPPEAESKAAPNTEEGSASAPLTGGAPGEAAPGMAAVEAPGARASAEAAQEPSGNGMAPTLDPAGRTG